MAALKVNKSDVIRDIIAAHSNASLKEIRTELVKRKVKASDALINKIKYGRKPTGTSSRTGMSKAESIREMWRKLGASARPRDVIAALTERGVKVTSAQVSMLRHRSGNQSTTGVDLEQLLLAKALVSRVGSIEAAMRALDCLAKLVEG